MVGAAMSDWLPWFKCCPEKLLSALSAMEADEGYIYVHILLRIYEVGGPISDPIRALARRAGMTERRATAAVNLLIDSGKVSICDSKIDSVTTHETLEEIADFRNGQSRAAKIGAEKRAEKKKQKQQNEPADAVPTQCQLRVETITPSLRSGVAPKRQPRKANPKTGIEADAQPNERNRAYSESLGMPADSFRSEWQGFRSHHRAKGSVMADWDAAWETWARNWTKFTPRAGPTAKTSGRETLTQIAMGNFYDEPQPYDAEPPIFPADTGKPGSGDLDLVLSQPSDDGPAGNIYDFPPTRAVWR
jgi:uncharacterized protein YdaU (DUF1376 family)